MADITQAIQGAKSKDRQKKKKKRLALKALRDTRKHNTETLEQIVEYILDYLEIEEGE